MATKAHPRTRELERAATRLLREAQAADCDGTLWKCEDELARRARELADQLTVAGLTLNAAKALEQTRATLAIGSVELFGGQNATAIGRVIDGTPADVPTVRPRADVCAFTDRRLPFDQLRTRRPLRRPVPRPRQRGPRRRRAAAARVRGSRRSLSRSSSRGGDSGDDDPDEPEPERGHHSESGRRRP